jgi:hypothetical protein
VPGNALSGFRRGDMKKADSDARDEEVRLVASASVAAAAAGCVACITVRRSSNGANARCERKVRGENVVFQDERPSAPLTGDSAASCGAAGRTRLKLSLADTRFCTSLGWLLLLLTSVKPRADSRDGVGHCDKEEWSCGATPSPSACRSHSPASTRSDATSPPMLFTCAAAAVAATNAAVSSADTSREAATGEGSCGPMYSLMVYTHDGRSGGDDVADRCCCCCGVEAEGGSCGAVLTEGGDGIENNVCVVAIIVGVDTRVAADSTVAPLWAAVHPAVTAVVVTTESMRAADGFSAGELLEPAVPWEGLWRFRARWGRSQLSALPSSGRRGGAVWTGQPRPHDERHDNVVEECESGVAATTTPPIASTLCATDGAEVGAVGWRSAGTASAATPSSTDGAALHTETEATPTEVHSAPDTEEESSSQLCVCNKPTSRPLLMFPGCCCCGHLPRSVLSAGAVA